jgi:hypothetical protein
LSQLFHKMRHGCQLFNASSGNGRCKAFALSQGDMGEPLLGYFPGKDMLKVVC